MGGYEETFQKLFQTEYNGHLEPAWAPFAFNHDGKAYIFYGPQKISVRTSDDGMNWSDENCLIRFSEAWHPNFHIPPHRDAMIIKIEEDGKDKWLLYATALMNIDKEPYYSGIELFESEDLLNWESIGFALTSSEGVPYYQSIGSFESPFVIKYGDYYYLSITYYGSNDYVRSKYTYKNTIVFRSLEPDNPYNFGNYNGDESMIVTRLDTHAPEYIFDPETDKWYITNCGWPDMDIPSPGGVAIAELKWQKDYR